MLQNENIKLKPLTKDQLIISADRLTRFKETETKYLRVFKDILTGNLISPKYKKLELDKMDYKSLTEFAVYLINQSLETFGFKSDDDYLINQRLFDYENSIFELNSQTQELIKNTINYKGLIKLLPDNCPLNLKWLKLLAVSANPSEESRQLGYHFPVKKLIICEGITEETLLPEFARLLDFDFDKNGIHIISAGGKNQVVKTFYKFTKNLKIPIFVLLDSDARENYNEIRPGLREKDKIHILNQGEFEDILPVKLIEKTLKYATENISFSSDNSIDQSEGMVHYLEEFFKKRGAHGFKKAEFARLVKLNITNVDDVSAGFREIIDEIKTYS